MDPVAQVHGEGGVVPLQFAQDPLADVARILAVAADGEDEPLRVRPLCGLSASRFVRLRPLWGW